MSKAKRRLANHRVDAIAIGFAYDKAKKQMASFGCDSRRIHIWGEYGYAFIAKRDAVKLAEHCLSTQKKFILIDFKAYMKDRRELERLRAAAVLGPIPVQRKRRK